MVQGVPSVDTKNSWEIQPGFGPKVPWLPWPLANSSDRDVSLPPSVAELRDKGYLS